MSYYKGEPLDFGIIPGGVSVPVIMRFANGFIDGLDRSVLGSFAVTKDELRNAVILRVISLNYTKNKPTDRDIMGMVLGLQQMCSVTVTDAARIEAAYWSESDFDSDNNMVTDDLVRLKLIAVSPPSFHDYYKADVWDVDVIKQCISEDIDAEMASRL